MNIIFVTPEFVSENVNFDGGLANYLNRTSIFLKSIGHNPVIIVTSEENKILNFNGIEVHRVLINYSTWFAKLSNVLTLGLIPESINTLVRSHALKKYIANYMKSNSVDIIQYSNYLALGYFHPTNVPVVVRISSNQPELRKSYGNTNPSIDILLTERLDLGTMKKADAVFGPSELNAQIIGSRINKEVTVIENPFELESVEYDYSIFENELSEIKGKKYLLFFGSVGILKGAGTISRVIKDILSIDHDLYFVFVGKDMTNSVDLLKKSAGGYSDRVVWVDKLQHNKLYPIIEKSYAAVLPSLNDNFPNTCLEAMAHGKVVIGTTGTSFDQLIENEVSGFLIEKDNSNQLLDRIRNILSSSADELEKMGKHAKERIEMIHPKKQVPILVEYYKSVISKHK